MHIYVFKIWYRRVKFNKHAIFRYWHINAVPKNLGFLAEPPCSLVDLITEPQKITSIK